MINRKIRCTRASVLAISGTERLRATPAPDQPTLEEVVVTGVRASEQKSVELKRERGVHPGQHLRRGHRQTAGHDDRGFVAAYHRRADQPRRRGRHFREYSRACRRWARLLNGESFLTSGSIVSVQPDFSDIPSQLFSGADVIKSPTANLLNSGITGTINLKTRRPFDLDPGLDHAGAVDPARQPDQQVSAASSTP